MTEDVLATMNRRFAVATVRSEAARAGLDADQLLDSAQFYGKVTGLDPDAPGFVRQVREMVQAASGAPVKATPAQPSATASGVQWVEADVDRATPAQVAAAADAGLLISLGVSPRRRRL